MKLTKKNILKKCLFLAFIIIVITIVISIIIKYNVEGETTLPYSIEKILIVSRVDTANNEDAENLWNINLTENNNVFIYIKKNENTTNETIKEIKINNFKIVSKPSIGQVVIYRPTGDLNNLYEYSEQDYLKDSITYTGAKVDTLKKLEIGTKIKMMKTITTIILAVITEITTQVAITIMAEATLLLSQFLLLIGALNLSVLQIQNEIRRTNLTQTILNLAQILPSGMCHLICQ